MTDINGNGNGRATLGLLILGLTSSLSVWASLTAPPATLFKNIAIDENNHAKKVAKDSMNIALGLILLLAIGILLIYKQKGISASIGVALTGVGLYSYYHYLLREGQKIKQGIPSRYSNV